MSLKVAVLLIPVTLAPKVTAPCWLDAPVTFNVTAFKSDRLNSPPSVPLIVTSLNVAVPVLLISVVLTLVISAVLAVILSNAAVVPTSAVILPLNAVVSATSKFLTLVACRVVVPAVCVKSEPTDTVPLKVAFELIVAVSDPTTALPIVVLPSTPRPPESVALPPTSKVDVMLAVDDSMAVKVAFAKVTVPFTVRLLLKTAFPLTKRSYQPYQHQ